MTPKIGRSLLGLAGSAVLLTTGMSCSSPRVGSPVAEPSTVLAAESLGDADKIYFGRDVAPVLGNYCTGCHSGPNAPAGVALDFANEDEARQKAITEIDFWNRVARNVSLKQMPPSSAPRAPSDEERAVLLEWINENVLTANGMPDPGPFQIRRLNTREYANTVRDLLYLPDDFDVTADFPADGRGDGFDNNASTLTISPLLIERYLEAAERATTKALALDPNAPDYWEFRDSTESSNAASHTRINEPLDTLRNNRGLLTLNFANVQEGVRVVLEAFAPRAFRRPVTEEEIDHLMEFAALSFAHNGELIDEATALAIRSALLSPEFLFRIERDPDPDGTGKVFEITEYQLANRLSYFLWSTMPDHELFASARDGTLRSDLARHVERMLQDPRAISLTEDFLGQWLEIRGLDEVPNASPELLEAMKGETEHFFNYIVRQDRSIMEFLDADYTFVNERLAEHYGFEGVTGEEFRRVDVDPSRRGGIFTQASFLTLTSKPLGDSRRTSPVVRGKWILENIYNETIPPPPPDVPELELDTNRRLTGTVRQIFEQHRENPVCAGCHARMDPYGFALENYDGYGAWRDTDNGVEVDASGEINGRSFATPIDFRALLADRQSDFRVALVRKMLSYGLGRAIRGTDRATIEEVAAAVEGDGDRFSSLVLNVVKSYPFQHTRGGAGRNPRLPVEALASGEVFLPARVEPAPIPETEGRTEPGSSDNREENR